MYDALRCDDCENGVSYACRSVAELAARACVSRGCVEFYKQIVRHGRLHSGLDGEGRVFNIVNAWKGGGKDNCMIDLYTFRTSLTRLTTCW